MKLSANYNQRFVFELLGLDAFLVCAVRRTPYVRNQNLQRNTLVVTLHDAAEPCTEDQIEGIIARQTAEGTTAVLKRLDSNGRVINERTYKGVYVERVDYALLDYRSSKLSNIQLTLSYGDVK